MGTALLSRGRREFFMTGKNKFVFIESNTTGTGELLICKALSKGLCPIFVTDDPKKYSFLPLENIELIILDSSNNNILFDYFSRVDNLIGIYSSSEYYIEAATWLAHKLGLLGTNLESIKVCRNKYLLYQALASSEINVPHTHRIFNLDEAKNVLITHIFPVIIKPATGSGSRGVKLCETIKDCIQHISFLFDNKYPEVLIQKYIDAPEYSVEVCSLSGMHQVIGITKKYKGNPPYFIETGHDFPAVLSSSEEEQIKHVVEKLLSILNFNFGFSHIEFKIKNKKIVIIEVNPRLAGGMIPILIEKATGIDLLNSLLDLYTNHHVDFQITYKKFAAIRHLVLNTAGKINHFNFKDKNCVEEVKIVKNRGDVFIPQGDFRDRVAYIIVSDEDAGRCKEKASQALQNFDIDVEAIE